MPPNGENVPFYANAEIGALEEQGLRSYDPAVRRPVYRRIAHILIEQVPEYVLDFLPEIAAANVDLQGVRPVPIGSDLWNVAAWTFAPPKP